MDQEVQSLLAKVAIEKTRTLPGFYSRMMFPVPKKWGGEEWVGGQWRQIIYLKPLNRYISAPHFTMSTIKDVFQLLQKDDWAITLEVRSKGCLLPCSNCCQASPVPTVHLEGPGIQIHSSSLQPFRESPVLYQSHQACGAASWGQGIKDSILSGQHTSATEQQVQNIS